MSVFPVDAVIITPIVGVVKRFFEKIFSNPVFECLEIAETLENIGKNEHEKFFQITPKNTPNHPQIGVQCRRLATPKSGCCQVA